MERDLVETHYRRMVCLFFYPMSLKLFFLRHGQTTFSRANNFCGSGLDPDLTEDGLAMSQAVAEAYRDTEWNAIYSSSLKRALQTAEPLSNALGAKIEPRDGLQEIAYGEWEGKTVEEVSKAYHDDYLRWTADPAWNPPTGGEKAGQVARRAMSVVVEILSHYEDGNVLVVSHKATIRIVLCSLLGIDVGRFRFRLGCPVGSISVVEFAEHGPLLHALADRSHLDARLRGLPGT